MICCIGGIVFTSTVCIHRNSASFDSFLVFASLESFNLFRIIAILESCKLFWIIASYVSTAFLTVLDLLASWCFLSPFSHEVLSDPFIHIILPCSISQVLSSTCLQDLIPLQLFTTRKCFATTRSCSHSILVCM